MVIPTLAIIRDDLNILEPKTYTGHHSNSMAQTATEKAVINTNISIGSPDIYLS